MHLSMGKFRSSLKQTIITYIFLVGLIPLGIGFVLVYFYGTRSVQNSIGTSFQEVAVETAHHVDAALDAEIQRMRLIANIPIRVKHATIQANRRYEGLSDDAILKLLARQEEAWSNGRFPDQKVLANDTARFLVETKEMAGDKIMGIMITDIHGAVIAATSRPKRFLHNHEAWWQGALDSSGSGFYVSDIVEKGSGTFVSQGDTLDIAIPIMDLNQEKPVGVLKVCYRFDNLFALINKVRIGQTGHGMLFASDGTPLVCPILPRTAHRMDNDLLRLIVSEKPGWAVAEDDGHGARQTVVGFAPLAGLKDLRGSSLGGKTWHVFVRQHPSESFAPLRDLLFKVGGVGIVLLGVLAFLGNYVGTKLARPVQALHEGVEAIRRGNLSHRLSLKTGNELETLAEAVNNMAQQLNASKVELESCNRSLTEQVTEQTKELTRQVRRMDAILNNMAEGLIIMNSTCDIEFMNPAARTLYGMNMGKRWSNLLYGRVSPCTESDHACPTPDCPVGALLSGSRDVYQYETRDQKGRTLQVNMVPTAGEDGKGLIVVLLRDVSRESKLKRQLILSERLATMGKMAGGIAHEINNPLGIVLNRIECIEREARGQGVPAGFLKDLAVIRSHASRIVRITKSLLTCSRDSAMTLKPLDVNTIVRDALDLVNERAKKSGIRMTCELADGLPAVMGDKDKIEAVVLNLLNNAIDEVPARGGVITVQTRKAALAENGGVQIAVSDNGPGVPPEFAEKVFEPFYTTKPAGRGTGLGLFLCYSIVKEHKGEIAVLPKQTGKGSTFLVTLPGLETRVIEEAGWTVKF
jgi:signal transduction histidine kinase/HAMP domain-containing protein